MSARRERCTPHSGPPPARPGRLGPGRACRTAAPKSASRARAASWADRTLVLCTLYGGNDGLNTVVPYENSDYKTLRPGMTIGEQEVLPIGVRRQ